MVGDQTFESARVRYISDTYFLPDLPVFSVMMQDFKVYGAIRFTIGNKLLLKLEDLDYSLNKFDVSTSEAYRCISDILR